jgi:soluble lytic murein transglycosylase-like protein
MKSKKAAIIPVWVPGLVFISLIVLTTSVIYLNDKLTNLTAIGEAQQQVFEAAIAAENTLIYIDSAASISARQAIIDTAFDGGYMEDKCGESYFGFKMWTTKGDECYPEIKDTKDAFIYTTNNNLNGYLVKYEELDLLVDYKYSIVQPQITIVGSPIKNLQIETKPTTPVPTTPPVVTPTTTAYKKLILREYTPSKTSRDALQKIYDNYGTLISEASVKYGVSEDLLAGGIMQESTGNPNAVSPTGCKGIAQFCAPTAYEYGLCDCKLSDGSDCPKRGGRGKRYCAERDDRTNVAMSIDAEARYYQYLLGKNVFGKYTDQKKFAVAAYNVGLGVILNAIKKTGKDNPSWEEVSAQLTPDLITYFKILADKTNKVVEVNNYVVRVTGYETVYASLPQGTATG